MPLFHRLFWLPRRFRQLLLAVSLGLIVSSSMRQGGGGPPEGPPFWLDFSLNLGHQLLYGFFALMALLRLDPQAPLRRQTWWGLLVLVFVMGVLDEWNQFHRLRGSGFHDVVSDCLGAFHILVLARWFSVPRQWAESSLLVLKLVALGLAWNFVVVLTPDIPLPFLSHD